jgi:hypothetical protein
VLASSSSIIISGSIRADSGSGCGTSGAAGAIRLVANAINVSGSFAATVVRLEGPLGSVSFNGSRTPPVIETINPTIFPSNQPIINIVSVGDYPVPSYSGSSFSTIDRPLPTQLPDPIAVKVSATNVPVGSPETVAFSGCAGATSTTALLSGTNASSSATVYVSGLNRSAVTYLFVSTTFDASLISANLGQPESEGVSKIELASAPGQKTTYRFLRNDGSEVILAKVPSELRHFFGF